MHDSGMTCILSKIHAHLVRLKLPDNEINEVLDDLSNENCLKMCNQYTFQSDDTCKTSIKLKFNDVVPLKVYLGPDTLGEERFYQYIPGKDTLKALMSQSFFREQYSSAKLYAPGNTDVLEDVRDLKTTNKMIFSKRTLPHCP